MIRTLFSIVYVLTSLLIGLGALGHDSHAVEVARALDHGGFDPGLARIVVAVWHFCSGCMLVFGVICVASWWPVKRNVVTGYLPPLAIGIFYLVTGVLVVGYTGVAFFWTFSVLGASLLASLGFLRALQAAAPPSSRA